MQMIQFTCKDSLTQEQTDKIAELGGYIRVADGKTSIAAPHSAMVKIKAYLNVPTEKETEST